MAREIIINGCPLLLARVGATQSQFSAHYAYPVFPGVSSEYSLHRMQHGEMLLFKK